MKKRLHKVLSNGSQRDSIKKYNFLILSFFSLEFISREIGPDVHFLLNKKGANLTIFTTLKEAVKRRQNE